MLKRRSRATCLLFAACLPLALACAPEEEPPPPDESEVAPGWVMASPFPDVQSLQAVVTISPTRAYAVGTNAALLRYVEGTWSREEPPAGVASGALLHSVSAAVDEESGLEVVLAVGEGGLVLERGEEGWTLLESGTDAHLFGVWLRNTRDGFIVGERGTILRYREGVVESMEEEAMQRRTLTDGTEELYRIPASLKAVSGGGGSVYAVGSGGSVYRFRPSDPDATWTRDVSGTSRPLTDVFTGAGVRATATDGVVLRRLGEPNDRGEDWVIDMRVPVPLYLQGVWGTGRDDLYAVGMAGSIFHFDGDTWATTALEEDAHLRAIDGVYEVLDEEEGTVRRTVFAVGAGGRILRGPSARPGDDRPETAPEG